MALHDRSRTYHEKRVDRFDVPPRPELTTGLFRRKFLGSPERAAVYLGTRPAQGARRLPPGS